MAPAIKVAGAVSLLSGLAYKAEERALFRSDNEEDLYFSVRIHSILQNSRKKAHSVRGGMKAATGNGSGKERE